MQSSDGECRHHVIAGGGCIGSSLAFYLTTVHHQRVTLVDPCASLDGQPFHPPAASGFAGGFLATWHADPLSAHGFALHEHLGKLFGDTDYRKLDTLSVTIGSRKRESCSKNARSVTRSSSLQKSSNLLNTPIVKSCKRIGSSLDSTAQVTPEALVMAFQREALKVKVGKTGASLLSIVRGSVVGVEFDESNMVKAAKVSTSTSTYSIPCTTVVACMGPWCGKASKWGGAFSQIPEIQGVKAHSIVMKTDGVSPVALFANYADDGKEIEFYPRPNGTTYWCGEADDWHGPVLDPPGAVMPDPEAISKLLMRGAELSPKFLSKNPERTAACHLPVVCTKNGSSAPPLIGELLNPDTNAKEGHSSTKSNAFVATGHSCWGILQAPSTGYALAELMVTGESSMVDLTDYIPANHPSII